MSVKKDWSTPEGQDELDTFVEQVRDIHVPTVRYDAGVVQMEWCKRQVRRGVGTCLVIGGRTGSGKSHLLGRNLLAGDFEPTANAFADPLPVLEVEAPSPGYPKAFAAELVWKVLGTAPSRYDSEPVLLNRFIDLAVKRQVKVVKVEEFQHVVDYVARHRHKEKVSSENIKSAINRAPFAWIIAGDRRVVDFFHDFEMLEDRGRSLPLDPFRWPDEEEDYAHFLGRYDEELAAIMGEQSGLAGMAQRFQLATGGLHGRAVRRILRDAAETAFMAGHRTVEVTLALTYGRWRPCDDEENPFAMTDAKVRRRLGDLAKASIAGTKGKTVRGRGKGISSAPGFGK